MILRIVKQEPNCPLLCPAINRKVEPVEKVNKDKQYRQSEPGFSWLGQNIDVRG